MVTHWMLLLSVVATGLLLGAWVEPTGGQTLAELAPSPDPGPCTPPANSSAPVGLRGYRRYFANDSLIGRPVPCTRDDRICFRHNLIFYPHLDRCVPTGGRDGVCFLSPNRTEFENDSGRIISLCKFNEDPCPGYHMAYDGRCYRKEVVRDVICGCGANLTRHLMGGVECRSSPATPIHIQQPEGEGRCLIPDLRFPDIKRSQFRQDPYFHIIERTRTQKAIPLASFKCNSKQIACFAKGKVWMNGTGSRGCHILLEQGPCPDEHIVALNIQSAIKGRAVATCVHVRGGCSRGHKRMLFDGECHEDREVALDVPGRIEWNQYGQNVVFDYDIDRWFLPIKENNFCKISESLLSVHTSNRRLRPPCGANDQGVCNFYEVEAEAPIPEL